MKLSYRAEICPTPTQRQALLQHAGNARWAYNWGLARCRAAHQLWVSQGRPKKWEGWPTAIGLHRELNTLKVLSLEEGGVPWMYTASKCAPQEALRDLERAMKNFLAGRAKYPRFKSKRRGVGGFRLTGSIKIGHRTVQLPMIGRVRFQPGERGYLPPGRPAQVSVREEAGRWFVAVLGPEVAEAAPNGQPAVGIDFGVAQLATLSDGTVYENPRALAQGQRTLKRLQKEVSRKKKGSSNQHKARTKLARAHARVRHVRADALQKMTTTLAKSHGRVVIEDLKLKNMTRKGGPRKRGLNRVLLDASLGEVRRLLEYKGRRFGCEVVAIPAPYTSQRCSACGHVDAGNRSSQPEFWCLSCGFQEHADLNAAKNILVAGSCPETLNAWGGDVRRRGLRPTPQSSMNQESGAT